jgi:hypothetical protein
MIRTLVVEAICCLLALFLERKFTKSIKLKTENRDKYMLGKAYLGVLILTGVGIYNGGFS